MEPPKSRTNLQIQIDTISKNLINVDKQYVRDLAIKLYPVMQSTQSQLCLFMNLKRYILSMKAKNIPMKQIASDICQKAFAINQLLGKGISNLMTKQTQFIQRFQTSSTNNQNNTLKNENNQQKKSIISSFTNDIENARFLAVNQSKKQYYSENITPVMGPIENNNFLDSSSLNQDRIQKFFLENNQHNVNSTSQNQQHQHKNYISSVQETKPQEQNMITQKKQKQNNNVQMPKTLISNNNNHNNFSISQNNNTNIQPTNKNVSFSSNTFNNQINLIQNIRRQKQKAQNQNKIDAQMLKKKLDNQKIMQRMEDPFTSARSILSPPPKPSIFNNNYTNGVHGLVMNGSSIPPSMSTINNRPGTFFPPPPSQSKPISNSFFGNHPGKKQNKKSIAQKYLMDRNNVLNISQKSICLCQTPCQNIVLDSQDTFLCFHCKNIYHMRCMQRTKQTCAICHLRYLIPNKVVHEEVFVGLLKKNKKKHQIYFDLSQDILNCLKSKKQNNFRLQVRCFRLKNQTTNIILFPDICSITLNSKQLKQFKPLHKQSSLKYRRDEPIIILKNFQSQNKLTVNETASACGVNQRIQSDDHLIGIYLIEQETVNQTVERIIKHYVTSVSESTNLLERNFHLGNNNAFNDDEEIISCEVVKIPLTCALTTEKLKYPGRGIFCRHFQCFDLRNYIIMTSQSSNPRWVCPICKASCYEYRIDCIITEILNQYTGCQKVQQLMLYKDGEYQVLDKDQQPIDQKGNKLQNPKPKNISQLKIQDRLKRQREKQAERQLLKMQQAEQKKKKRIVELPPEDLIVNLLSDSD